MAKEFPVEQESNEGEKSLPRLGKLAIIETMRYLSLPQTGYFVVGGANLVLRGIRSNTTDLDILVSEDVFAQLAEEEGAELHDPPRTAIERGADNKTVWVMNVSTPMPVSATTAMGDGFYPMSFASHKEHTDVVGGIPCLALEQVQASKLALRRPKDIEDLAAIALFLGEPSDLPAPVVSSAWADY